MVVALGAMGIGATIRMLSATSRGGTTHMPGTNSDENGADDWPTTRAEERIVATDTASARSVGMDLTATEGGGR